MPSRVPRMTSAQHHALTTVHEDGRLRSTDRRTLHALRRRGWAEHHQRRRTSWWAITDAGRAALATHAVETPRLRPQWRQSWTRARLGHARYLVEDHELHQPARSMLWRVRCPARSRDKPVGHAEDLHAAVEVLAEHLNSTRGQRCTSTDQLATATSEPPR